MYMKNILPLILIFIFSLKCLSAQNQASDKNITFCGAHQIFEERLQKAGISRHEYEQLLQREIQQNRNQKILENGGPIAAEDDKVITIPVVFHIIHSGDGIGEINRTGDIHNPSEKSIKSNLALLNTGFAGRDRERRIIDPIFRDVVAENLNIRFALAQRDPDGLPTTGITRVALKPEDYRAGFFDGFLEKVVEHAPMWDKTRYFNIFVIPGLTNNFVSGLGSIPTTPMVEGLQSGLTHPHGLLQLRPRDFWDGILLVSFDLSVDKYKKLILHETGHYLGLLHTFEKLCDSYNDYCDDTPAQTSPANDELTGQGCGTTVSPCNAREKIQKENYMDYSFAQCQAMFTTCQGKRMRETLMYGNDRRTLGVDKTILTPLTVRTNDLGLSKFNEVVWNRCEEGYEGTIRVVNTGGNAVTSVRIDFSVNGKSVALRTFPIEIEPYTLGEIAFDPIPTTETGELTLQATIAAVNNKTDTNAENNEITFTNFPPRDLRSPFSIEGFEEEALVWHIPKKQEALIKVVPKVHAEGNMLAFQMEGSPIESRNQNLFIKKHLDFSSLADNEVALISFSYNYRVPAYRTEALFTVDVAPSTNACKVSEDIENLYRKVGLDINTSITQEVNELPRSPFDWEKVTLSLPKINKDRSYTVYIHIRNAGIGTLYLDDLEIIRRPKYDREVSVVELVAGPVGCSSQRIYTQIQNQGKTAVAFPTDKKELGIKVNGELNQPSAGLVVGPNQITRWQLMLTNSGLIKLEVILGISDGLRKNNIRSTYIYSNARSEEVRRFPSKKAWALATSNEVDNEWKRVFLSLDNNETPQGYLQAPLYKYKDGSGTPRHTPLKLVSPIYNLSNLDPEKGASLSFRISYGYNGKASDRLQVLAFTDCIPVPIESIHDKVGIQLATALDTDAWIPKTQKHWRQELIDISQYIGKKEVYFMMVATSDEGNNLYVDDFILHDSRTPNLQGNPFEEDAGVVQIYPNPSEGDYVFSFNIAESEDVKISFIDAKGNVAWVTEYENVDSSVRVLAPAIAKGAIYFVYLEGETFSEVKRVIKK